MFYTNIQFVCVQTLIFSLDHKICQSSVELGRHKLIKQGFLYCQVLLRSQNNVVIPKPIEVEILILWKIYNTWKFLLNYNWDYTYIIPDYNKLFILHRCFWFPLNKSYKVYTCWCCEWTLHSKTYHICQES